jgi:hypothetical protein
MASFLILELVLQVLNVQAQHHPFNLEALLNEQFPKFHPLRGWTIGRHPGVEHLDPL